jgi:hypothetical protein
VDHGVGDGAARLRGGLLRDDAPHRGSAVQPERCITRRPACLLAVDHQHAVDAAPPVAGFGQQRHVEDHRAVAGRAACLRWASAADHRVQDGFEPGLGGRVGEGERRMRSRSSAPSA